MASQSLPIDFTNCLFLGDGDLFAVDGEGLVISALMALSPLAMHRIELQHVRGSLGAALDFVDVHDLQVRVPKQKEREKVSGASAIWVTTNKNQMTSRTISFTPVPYAAEGQTPYTSEAIDANLDRHVVFSSLNCLRCHIKTNFLLSRTYVHLVHHIPSLYLHPVIYIFVLFVLLFFSFWKDLC